MESTPDIAKVVGLIMQNPELIETIKGMMGKSDVAQDSEVNEDRQESKNDIPETKEAMAMGSANPDSGSKRKRRNTLLQALKPYVSEGRSRAIDTMMTIADMLDAVKGG